MNDRTERRRGGASDRADKQACGCEDARRVCTEILERRHSRTLEFYGPLQAQSRALNSEVQDWAWGVGPGLA